MLAVFVAAQQGWTMAEARAQPVDDLCLLAAHYVLEGEEVKRRTTAARGGGGASTTARGGKHTVVEQLRFVNPNYRPNLGRPEKGDPWP